MATTKHRGGFARAAISAALTGILAFNGVLAPPRVALADPQTVTIYGADNNPITKDSTNAVYSKAVLVFKANEIDNSQNENGGLATESNAEGGQKIEWSDETAGTGVKAMVSAFLQEGKEQTGAGQDYLDWLKEKNYITGDNASAASYAALDDAGKAVFDTAKYAAAYIGQEIAKANAVGTAYVTNTTNPNVPNITGTSSFADKLAAALQEYTGGAVTEATADDANLTFKLNQTGYYVLMGTTDKPARPIWLPFNNADGDLDIYSKSNIPTLEKVAYEGGDELPDDADFQKTVDAGNGEKVFFKLTATVPEGTYDKLVFTDTLPADSFAHGELPSDIVVKVGDDEKAKDTDYTLSDALTAVDADGVETTDEANIAGYRFSIEMAPNAKNPSDAASNNVYTVDAQTTITVTYWVTLAATAGMGADALNVNTARLSYGTGQTYSNEATASVATFQLRIKKVDSVTGELLTGAKFTIKDTNGTDDSADDDKFLKPGDTNKYEGDGTFAVTDATEDAYTFEVNSSDEGKGLIGVTHVDATKFLISETTAPAGKAPIADFTVEFKPEYDAVTGELTALNAEAKGVEVEATSAAVEVDAATGLVTVTVPNGDEEVRLPVTGMTPSQLGTIVGLVLVAVGAFVVIKRRRQTETA